MNSYKLSSFEARVFDLLQLQPELTAAAAARRLKSRPHRVAYVIRRLIEEKLIEKRVLVNPFVLGNKVIVVFFSLTIPGEATRVAALKEVAGREGVSWVASYSGRMQVGVVLHAPTLEQGLRELGQLGVSLRGRMRDKTVAIRTHYYQFPRRYLQAAPDGKDTFLHLTANPLSVQSVKLTAEERAIVVRLAHGSFPSQRELARELGQPISSLENRIQTLRKKNVISASFYSLDVRRMKILSYKILLSMQQCHPQVDEQVLAFCRRNVHVCFLLRTLGSWDYEIGVECFSPQDLMNVIGEIYQHLEKYLDRLEVLEEVSVSKFSLFPFSHKSTAS